MEEKKPQLHQSQLNTLYRCGEQFRRVYILGDREPPGIALIVGSSTHQVIKDNLNYKIEHDGLLMSLDEIKDRARDAFVHLWENSPVILTDEEKNLGIRKVKGQGVDDSVKLSVLHHTELAPHLQPGKGGIEWKWVIKCEGYPFDLAGMVDIKEKIIINEASLIRIRDTKTRNRAPGQREADTSEQLTMYAMATMIMDKHQPEEVCLDVLVKGEVPRLIIYPSKRSYEDFVSMKLRFERACEVIEKGIFTPTSRSNWWCSVDWCGFARDGSCPFYSGKKSVSIVTKKTKGDSHGRKRKLIPAGSEEWCNAAR